MNVNELPFYDTSDNATQCCPRFEPAGWDKQELHFAGKLFASARTRSLFHIPVNMSRMFNETTKAIEAAGAQSDREFIVLSRDLSPWAGEHYFSVTKEVPGQDMVHLSGEFLTRVFEGPYRNVRKWEKEVVSHAALELGFSAWVLLPWLTLPFALSTARDVFKRETYQALVPTTPKAGRLLLAYSVLLAIGVAIPGGAA